MALPETIRVKLSSEEAGSISITPVVLQEMPSRELIERILEVTGKDADRIRDLLLRGAMVSGASRFRWDGWDADIGEIEAVLSTFPDPAPERPFAGEACVMARFHGAGRHLDLPRQLGARRRLLRKSSFWDALLEILEAEAPEYVDYSYREQADCYRVHISAAVAERIRRSASLLSSSPFGLPVPWEHFQTVDLYVPRSL